MFECLGIYLFYQKKFIVVLTLLHYYFIIPLFIRKYCVYTHVHVYIPNKYIIPDNSIIAKLFLINMFHSNCCR